MNWYKKAQQRYLWEDDPELSSANANSMKEYWDLKYPKAGEVVSGLKVTNNIDNIDSISASLKNYYVYPGIRECPMSEFGEGGSYSFAENKRSTILADEIKVSRQISPLIVVVDKEGPYILEGSHRFDALYWLSIKSFPALIILDLDEEGIE